MRGNIAFGQSKGNVMFRKCALREAHHSRLEMSRLFIRLCWFRDCWLMSWSLFRSVGWLGVACRDVGLLGSHTNLNTPARKYHGETFFDCMCGVELVVVGETWLVGGEELPESSDFQPCFLDRRVMVDILALSSRLPYYRVGSNAAWPNITGARG